MSGKELFDRDNLGEKGLKKLDKAELVGTIEMNLQPLCEYFYDEIHHKEEREYRQTFTELVLNKKLFLKPVFRVATETPESIPEGLAFVLYDTLKRGKQQVDAAIASEKATDKPEDEKLDSEKRLNAVYLDVEAAIYKIFAEICEKNIKKLKKIGFKKPFALAIAPLILSPDYVTPKNLFRFVPTVTSALYAIYESSVEVLDDRVITHAGADLKDPKVIGQVFGLMMKKMDENTAAEFIKQILLEKRDKNFDSLTKNQINVYGAITNWALKIMESKEIFGNKQRRAIIKGFGEQRIRDDRRQRDARRRVAFNELDPDMYPRICKAYMEEINSSKG